MPRSPPRTPISERQTALSPPPDRLLLPEPSAVGGPAARCYAATFRTATLCSGTAYFASPQTSTMALLVSKYTCQ